MRNEVNKWIRETKPDEGGFDAFFDFDKELKDPKDETRLDDIYDCGDGIHPSLKGYQKMVDCIKDLSLFAKE
jgi:lysophospholipase L1-like esterase